MTIENDLKLMVNLQNKLNTYILGDNWTDNNKADWIRAAWIECAELMDWCGYKWWKKQTPNIPQAQIELVDIWHFLLSEFIKSGEKNGQDISLLIDALDYSPRLYKEWQSQTWQGNKFTSLNAVEALVFSLITESDSFYADFFALCLSLDLSFESLTEQYIAKNVLNIFRQDKGYKLGTYIKEWPSPLEPNQTVEDNVFLEMFMQEAKDAGIKGEKLFDFVYQRLVDNYPQNLGE